MDFVEPYKSQLYFQYFTNCAVMHNTETKWIWLDTEREGMEHLEWICDFCFLAIYIYLYSTLTVFR